MITFCCRFPACKDSVDVLGRSTWGQFNDLKLENQIDLEELVTPEASYAAGWSFFISDENLNFYVEYDYEYAKEFLVSRNLY